MSKHTYEAIESDELSLPYIPRDKRIIPNDMIRSSLFSVSNKKIKRQYLRDYKLYSFHSTDLIYTGEELRQDDEDVWLQLIFYASDKKNEYIEFRPYTFLSQIGWPKRTQYKEQLKSSLTRMSSTTLKIFNKDFKQGIGISLVRRFEWIEEDESHRIWRVWLEPEIVKLFSLIGSMYTKIHWEQRSKLKPLAKWLHSFYSSHAEPSPVPVYKLMKLSGSKAKAIRHFRENLRNSLLELCQIGFAEDFFIDHHDHVCITRSKKGRIIKYG